MWRLIRSDDEPAGSTNPPRVVRVLVPHTFARWGGVRSLLAAAVPRLNRVVGLEFEYAELFRNDSDMDEMEGRGVRVNRTLGLHGKGVLSARRGTGRWVDLLRAAPFLMRLLWRLRTGLKEYDVVYAHLVRDLFLVGLAAGTIRRARRPIVVWHCHGIGDRGARLLIRCLANGCAAVVAVSEDVAERLGELGVHRELVNVVRNAVDPGAIRAAAANWSGEFPRKAEGKVVLLLATASVRYDKGVHLAVRALQQLPPNVELWVTGEPEDAESARYKDDLQHLVEVGGLGGRVLFLGLRRDIYGIMSRADVIVVPSVWREPFGLVAAEAMALERPVVVANRGALPEVVDHGKAGLVFDQEVDGSLAEKVAETIADGTATGQRVESGLRRVNNLYGYDRWVSEIAEVLRTASTCGKTRATRSLRRGPQSGGKHG